MDINDVHGKETREGNLTQVLKHLERNKATGRWNAGLKLRPHLENISITGY